MILRSSSGPLRCLLAACVLLASGEVAAVPSVDLLFTELNGTSIAETNALAVRPGDQIGVAMRLNTDVHTIWAYSISVDFDSAENERITLDSFANLPPFPLTEIIEPHGPDDFLSEASPDLPGMVRHFTGFFPASPTRLPPTANSSLTIGTLDFIVTENIFEGPAVIAPGIFITGVDEILGATGLLGDIVEFNEISAAVSFNTASLTAASIPEPSSVALLGLGMLGLLVSRRAGLLRG